MISVSQGDIFLMPGGEAHIKCDEPLWGNQRAVVRGASATDLMQLAIWADAVKRDGGTTQVLMPYLPAARQDRRQIGEALSARVYAELINSMELDRIVCLDPHSDVMPAMINRLEIVSAVDLLRHCVHFSEMVERYDGIIIPDVGAYKRAWEVAKAMRKPIYQAFKHRDMMTGKLSGFTCTPLPTNKRFLIVDDICDGGGTFLGLADAILSVHKGVKLDLYVSHGIFSGETAEGLHKYFDRIYTSNSFEPMAVTAQYNTKFWDKVRIIDAISVMENYL